MKIAKSLFIFCWNFVSLERSYSFEYNSVQSLFTSFFVHNLVRKIYVKMSQNWKNVKTSKEKFFINFSDIFMWVIVGENTFPGSVLNTISWSENSCGKKAPSFWTSHRFTHFLNELFTFSRYFRTFGQHVLT